MSNASSKICVIGAGKFAHSLVPYLITAGYDVNIIVNKTLYRARALAKKFGIQKYSSKLTDAEDANVFFLCVPDDKLQIVSADIVDNLNRLKNKYFVHFSGVLNSGVLRQIEKRGGLTASFHLIQTFPSKKQVNISNSFATIETKHKSLEKFLFALSKKFGLTASAIKSEKKTAYHMSAVYASNFLVSNMYVAERLFKSAKIKYDYFKAIEPIIQNTLDNIKQAGVVNSISGPVERGDIETIRKHISVLNKKKTLLRNYIVQSLTLLEIKKEQNNFTSSHKEISDYLLKKLNEITD